MVCSTNCSTVLLPSSRGTASTDTVIESSGGSQCGVDGADDEEGCVEMLRRLQPCLLPSSRSTACSTNAVTSGGDSRCGVDGILEDSCVLVLRQLQPCLLPSSRSTAAASTDIVAFSGSRCGVDGGGGEQDCVQALHRLQHCLLPSSRSTAAASNDTGDAHQQSMWCAQWWGLRRLRPCAHLTAAFFAAVEPEHCRLHKHRHKRWRSFSTCLLPSSRSTAAASTDTVTSGSSRCGVDGGGGEESYDEMLCELQH